MGKAWLCGQTIELNYCKCDAIQRDASECKHKSKVHKKLSSCCGAPIYNTGLKSSDLDICSDCGNACMIE